MQILLKTDIKKLGRRGEIVEVTPGYARNFLIPQLKAEPATKGALKQFQSQQKATVRRDESRREELEALAQKVGNISCTIVAQANPEGHLFGSVGAQNIAEALAQEGIEVQPSAIRVGDPIKEVGVYLVKVQVAAGLAVTTRVWVVAA